MENLVIMKEQQAVTTSLQVAETFEKRHDAILRDLDNLKASIDESPQNWGDLFWEDTYTHPQNKQPYRMIFMNRDGFTLLAMGFTGKEVLRFKLAYINAFNAMERVVHAPMSMEDIMISTLETQKQLKIEVRDIKDDVHQLKEEQPIAPYPLLKMDTARKRKVIEVLGGKKSNAYRTISKRVFSEAGRDFKEFFGIPRYDMLPKKHAEQGLDYWNDWEPCTNTKMEIKEFNSQIALEV